MKSRSQVVTFWLEPIVHEDAMKYVKENDLGSLSRLLRHLLKVEIYREKSLSITSNEQLPTDTGK